MQLLFLYVQRSKVIEECAHKFGKAKKAKNTEKERNIMEKIPLFSIFQININKHL